MQTQSPAPQPPAPSGSTAPDSPADGRAGEFHAVQGGPEMRSGEQLLVEAYALIWLFLLAWLVIVWRKQNVIGARLRDLEAAIARADSASAAKDRG
jgi:hypothetical protein